MGAWAGEPLVDDGKGGLVSPGRAELVEGLREDLLYSPVTVVGDVIPEEGTFVPVLRQVAQQENRVHAHLVDLGAIGQVGELLRAFAIETVIVGPGATLFLPEASLYRR